MRSSPYGLGGSSPSRGPSVVNTTDGAVCAKAATENSGGKEVDHDGCVKGRP